MITISDGILTIPEGERFVGFSGDNGHTQKVFYIRNCIDSGWLYRLYLTFDDGRHNYFALPASVDSGGTRLVWNIREDHILKSGIIKAQLKAFSSEEEVYHTTSDVFVAGRATEEDDEFKNGNSEFLQMEKSLNRLYEKMKTASAKMPYVGDNGNWYLYDWDTNAYKDSGSPTSVGIAKSSVTPDKLDRSYWQLYERIPVSGYDYFDSLLEDSVAANAIYRVEFSGLSPIKAVVGDGSFAAIAAKDLSSLLLINLTNGEGWVYEKGSSALRPVNAKLADASVTAEKIVDGSVTPQKLDRRYCEALSVARVMTANPQITLESATEYRILEYADTLTIKLPQLTDSTFESSVIFKSNTTPTALTCPSSVKWSGDDVCGVTKTENGSTVTYNCLVPQSRKIYNVIFWYDGFNYNAAVRGVALE